MEGSTIPIRTHTEWAPGITPIPELTAAVMELTVRMEASGWVPRTIRAPEHMRAARRLMDRMVLALTPRPTTHVRVRMHKRVRVRTFTETGDQARCSAVTAGRK